MKTDMDNYTGRPRNLADITISDELIKYLDERGGDFRICTSCSGPVLLSVKVKQPKTSDISIKAGGHTIYISRYQIPYISEISMELVPRFLSSDLEYAYY
ncbi:MAG TPA: hypothetical protein O0W90_00300 [Methanocorpusculum sp.]|nr:hypothetical protein [Methanocorpusculum sp.]